MANGTPLSIPDFALKIKTKYPEYKDVEDNVLVNKIVEKYPEYKDQVSLGEPVKKKESTSPSSQILSENASRTISGAGSKLETEEKPIQTNPYFAGVPADDDPIGQLMYSNKLKGIKSTSSAMSEIGGDADTYDPAAQDAAKKIDEGLSKTVDNPAKLFEQVKDVPERLFMQPGFTKAELMQDRRDNPQLFERKLATGKWQIGITDSINKQFKEGNLSQEDRGSALSTIKQNLDNINVGDYRYRRETAKRLFSAIEQYGGEDKERLKKNLAIDLAKIYGGSFQNKFSETAKEDPNSKYLDESQLLAYQFLQDTDPEKAKGYGSALIDESKLGDNLYAQHGLQEKKARLTEIGVGLQQSFIQEQLNDLAKIQSTNGQLSPDQEKKAAELTLRQEELNDVLAEKSVKYGIVDVYNRGEAVQEILGQENTGAGYLFNKVGTSTANTVEGVVDLVSEPFRSDEGSKIHQLEAAGENMASNSLNYVTSKNSALKNFELRVQPELQKQIDVVKNDATLSRQQKEDKVNTLLRDNSTEWGRVPIQGGKVNINPSSLFYSIGGLAADLVPFMALETVTGGGATAGAGRKLLSTFTSAAATGFHDAYATAVREGEANPFSHALRVTAINSAALAGAGTPQAIKAMLGTKTAVGELVSKMSDDAITAALKQSPAALKNFGKSVLGAFKTSTKEGAKISAFTTVGEVANMALDGKEIDPETLAKQALVSTLTFSLGGGLAGIKGRYDKVSNLQSDAVLKASQQPEMFIEAANKQYKEGALTAEQFRQIKENVEKAAEVSKKLPFVGNDGKPLSSKNAAKLLMLKMREAEIKESVTGDAPPALKEKNVERLEELNTQIEDVYKNKDDGIVVEAPKKVAESIIPKTDEQQAGENGVAIEMPNKIAAAVEIKGDPIETAIQNADNIKVPVWRDAIKSGDKETVTQALKEISEQWHDEGSRKQSEAAFGKEVIDAAKELFPMESQKSLSIEKTNEVLNPEASQSNSNAEPIEVSSEAKEGSLTKKIKELLPNDKGLNDAEKSLLNDLVSSKDADVEEVVKDFGGYKRNDYEYINNILRRGEDVTIESIKKEKPSSLSAELEKESFDKIKDVLDNTELQPSKKMVLYRVLFDKGADLIDKHKVGDEFRDKGITSTTIDEGWANNNTSLPLVRYELNKGDKINGFYLSGVEKEFVIKPNTKFTVTGKEVVDGRLVLTVKPKTEIISKNKPSETGAGEPPKGKEPVDNGIFVEDKRTILSHKGLQEVATEFGLDDVSARDRVSDLREFKDAEETIDTWTKGGKYKDNIEKLISDAEGGEALNFQQRVIMQQHLANMRGEVSKIRAEKGIDSPEYNKALKELSRIKEAGQTARSTAGAALRVGEISSNAKPTMEDWMSERMESLSVEELTPEQKKQTEQQFNDYEAKTKAAEDKAAQFEEEVNRLKAELEVAKNKKAVVRKKNREYLAKERTEIVESIRDKLKKSRGETSAVAVPYAKELIAIAPDVAKLVRNLVETGTSKLEDVIDAIHDTLKDSIKGLRKEDVRDVIAGVYNEPKPMKSALELQLKDIKDEAKLIKRLEDLQNGEPITPKQQAIRNKEITKLRNKIKEFKAEQAKAAKGEPVEKATPEEVALKAIKSRNESAAKKLQDRIDAGDFETKKKVPFDENAALKKANPKLWRETMDAIVAKDEARSKFDLAKRQDELSKRTKLKKAIDFGAKLVATSRAIKAGIDDSVTFVQLGMSILANPKSGAKAKIEAIKDINNNRFKRQLAALHNSPQWDLIQKSGLEITEPKSISKEKTEELFESNLLNQDMKIFGGRNPWTNTGGIFERLFTSMGNNMRLNLFLKRAEYLQNQGKTFESHSQEYKDVARIVNEMTGRGKMNKYLEMASPVVTPIIWAPRMLSSSLNLLGLNDLGHAATGNKGFYANLTPSQRNYAFGQMGKGIGMGIGLMTIAAMNGATVDNDPQSVTFGNIKFGTKSYNVFGRFNSMVRFVVQMMTGVKKQGNQQLDLDQQGRGKPAMKFIRGKFTPAAGLVYDLWLNSGKNSFTREPITVSSLPNELLTPISVGNIKKGMDQDGSLSLLTRFLPEFEGIQVSDERDFENGGYTSEQKKAPEFKLLIDNGIQVSEPKYKDLSKFGLDITQPDYDKWKVERRKQFDAGIKKLYNTGLSYTPAGKDEPGVLELNNSAKLSNQLKQYNISEDQFKSILKEGVEKVGQKSTKAANEIALPDATSKPKAKVELVEE